MPPPATPPKRRSTLDAHCSDIARLRAKCAQPTTIHNWLRLHVAGYTGTVSAIKRLCQRLAREEEPKPESIAIAVETGPGEVAQVDFGYAGQRFDPVQKVIRSRRTPGAARANPGGPRGPWVRFRLRCMAAGVLLLLGCAESAPSTRATWYGALNQREFSIELVLASDGRASLQSSVNPSDHESSTRTLYGSWTTTQGERKLTFDREQIVELLGIEEWAHPSTHLDPALQARLTTAPDGTAPRLQAPWLHDQPIALAVRARSNKRTTIDAAVSPAAEGGQPEIESPYH